MTVIPRNLPSRRQATARRVGITAYDGVSSLDLAGTPLREREHIRNRPTRLLRPIRLRRIRFVLRPIALPTTAAFFANGALDGRGVIMRNAWDNAA